MGHFSYMGDAQVGAHTNIGAGTITCNYDGKNKNQTIIGENVFIGSDSMLVAPLTIGDNARTGAGAVVTKNIPHRHMDQGVTWLGRMSAVGEKRTLQRNVTNV